MFTLQLRPELKNLASFTPKFPLFSWNGFMVQNFYSHLMWKRNQSVIKVKERNKNQQEAIEGYMGEVSVFSKHEGVSYF